MTKARLHSYKTKSRSRSKPCIKILHTSKRKVVYTNSATKDLNNNCLAREVAKLPDGSIIFVLDADGLLTSWAIANSTNGKSVTIVSANHRSLKECQEMQGQCNLLMKRYPNVNMILLPNTTADQAMMDLSREGKVISAIYLDYCGTYAKYGASGLNILAKMGLLSDQRDTRVLFTFDKRNERAISDRADSSSPGADALRSQLLKLETEGFIDINWRDSDPNYSYSHLVGGGKVGRSSMWCANLIMRRGTTAPIQPHALTTPSSPELKMASERLKSSISYNRLSHADGSEVDVRWTGSFRGNMLWRGFRDEVRVGEEDVMRRLVFDGKESDVLFPIVEQDTPEFDDNMKEALDDQGTTVEDEYTKCEECFLEALPRDTTPDSMLERLQSFNPDVTSLDMHLPDDFEENKGDMRHAKVTAVYTEKHARRGNQRLSKHLDLDASVGFVFENTEGMEELTVDQFCYYSTKQTT